MFSELIFPMNRYGLLWGPFEKRRQHHSTININVIGVITDESMVYDVIPTKCHGIGTSTKTLPRKPDKKVRRTVRIYIYIYICCIYMLLSVSAMFLLVLQFIFISPPSCFHQIYLHFTLHGISLQGDTRRLQIIIFTLVIMNTFWISF